MDLIQTIASLLEEDPNSVAGDLTSLTIDQNKAARDTSLVNQTLAKNQKKSVDQAKQLEKKAGDKAKKLQNQFSNLRKTAGQLTRSSTAAADNQKKFNDAIQQIATSMSELEG